MKTIGIRKSCFGNCSPASDTVEIRCDTTSHSTFYLLIYASAERALSKLKIIKNRLRSSLCDDMLSSLMLIASEKDLMHAIRNEDVINRIANATPSLKAHLLFW